MAVSSGSSVANATESRVRCGFRIRPGRPMPRHRPAGSVPCPATPLTADLAGESVYRHRPLFAFFSPPLFHSLRLPPQPPGQNLSSILVGDERRELRNRRANHESKRVAPAMLRRIHRRKTRTPSIPLLSGNPRATMCASKRASRRDGRDTDL